MDFHDKINQPVVGPSAVDVGVAVVDEAKVDKDGVPDVTRVDSDCVVEDDVDSVATAKQKI